MRPFVYERAQGGAPSLPENAAFLAGGTTLVDLMKLDVLRPQTLVDINPLAGQYDAIAVQGGALKLGAMARMAQTADHPDVRREFPVIAQSLQLAASAQIRNMASLGGNVLQRTRCPYFRDTSYAACNKRIPGSGCSAIGGPVRKFAILGGSDHCIATYPGDFGTALAALGAEVEILSAQGGLRVVAFEDLHRLPGDTPHVETMLQPGDFIAGFTVPAGAWGRRSLYLKIRDRESYEFALTSAAVALDMADGLIRDARIGLGGVATKPWRAHAAEQVLRGKPFDESLAEQAAEAALAEAAPQGDNAFKPDLSRRTLVRALAQCAKMEI